MIRSVRVEGSPGRLAAGARHRGGRARAGRRARGRRAGGAVVRHGLRPRTGRRPSPAARSGSSTRFPRTAPTGAPSAQRRSPPTWTRSAPWWRTPGLRARAALRPGGLRVRRAGGHHRRPAPRQRRPALQVNETRFEKIADASSRDRRRRASTSISSTTTGRSPTGSPCGEGGGTADGAGVAIVYLATCCGRADRGRRRARAAPCLRGAAGERPAERLPRLDAGTRATRAGDILYPYAPDRAGSRARARRRPQRLLRARRRLARRPGLALAPPRDEADPARADDRGRWLGRERRARDRLRGDAARREWDQGSAVVLDALPAEGQRLRPLVGRLHGQRTAAP